MFKAWFKNKEPEIYQQLVKINKYIIPFYVLSFIICVAVYFSVSYLKFEQFLLLTTVLMWLIILSAILVISPSLFTALKILPKSKCKLLVSSYLVFSVVLFVGLISLAIKSNLFLTP